MAVVDVFVVVVVVVECETLSHAICALYTVAGLRQSIVRRTVRTGCAREIEK